MKNILTTLPVIDTLPRNIKIDKDTNIIISGISQSGKTAFIFNFLEKLEKKFIYVDCESIEDIDFNKLEKTVQKDSFQIIIFDIYENNIRKYLTPFLEMNIQIIIISWMPIRLVGFKRVNIFPLNFEEFLSFRNSSENVEVSFSKYSKTGGFPIFAKYSDEFIFQEIKRLMYFALSEFEIDIVKNIAKNSGTARTVLNIYNSLKEKRRISKDKLYDSFNKLLKIGYFSSVQEYKKPIHKKYYLIDPALQHSFESERNFLKLFENIVISELFKRNKKGFFYKSIDFFIPRENKGVLSLPFIELESLQRRITRNILDFKFLKLKKIEIITMDLETVFEVANIKIEVIKFTRWALL